MLHAIYLRGQRILVEKIAGAGYPLVRAHLLLQIPKGNPCGIKRIGPGDRFFLS